MSDSATFGETGNIQSFTVSVSGDYVITAEGATGGSVAAGDAGGAGAEVTGTFYLNAGDTLDILVGEVGANGTSSSGGGGGGGTFIYDATTATLLEAAGGGGGASEGDNLTGVPGDPGQAGNADGGGVRGGAAGTTISAAGAGNHPVGMPNDGNGNGYSYGGGGGGGFAYDGQSTQGVDQGYGGGGGESFLDALSGSTLPYGQGGDAHGDGGDGGYGGGGGGQYFYGGGGGGGGYTGGGGGGGGVTDYGYGGGGGSYDAGSNATLTTGVNASGNGLAMIDPEMQCFVSGTRILGAEGDVLVEDIRVGDPLITALNGAAEVAEVVWVGRRAVDISRHPEPGLVRPVCIMAGAIAPGLPERDLYVSPHHALYIDGALFEAISLVNGISILQPARGGTVTYHHIALAGHGIILAEAMPAETFLDTGGKGDFMDGQVASLHPRFAASAEAVRCAELVLHGPELEQLRARIRARALAIAA